MSELDLELRRRVHVVGVGGAGMSAIAEVLLGMGHQVTGSDLAPSLAWARLKGLGVDVVLGHAPDRVSAADVVAVSSAVPAEDPEVLEAVRRGIPVMSRADALAAIARARRTIAVSGTHGKTTTSAMLALVLAEGGLRPSFVVGGRIAGLQTGARWDAGEWLVVEADESDGTFLELPAEVAVVTSVEPDHLEHYGGFDSLVAAFDGFLSAASGFALVCADDPVASSLAGRWGAATYGSAAAARYRMVDVVAEDHGSSFALELDGGRIGDLRLPLPGRHNALNAVGAAATALEVGVPFDAVARALARFPGVARRYELRGRAGGVTFVDDYAHLPTEVTAALSGAREGDWRRVVCVFQPHRYSRTGALWADFVRAFDAADVLVVTDVYAAGEPPRPGVSGRLISDAVLSADPTRRVVYLPDRDELIAYLRRELRPGDLCLTLGAGDLTTVPDVLLGAGAGHTSRSEGPLGPGPEWAP